MLSLVLEIDVTASEEKAKILAEIWNEVVSSIIKEMLDYTEVRTDRLHINLREEMTVELGKLISFLSKKVVEDRMKGRLVVEINPEIERKECFNEQGRDRILNTARGCADNIWIKNYKERWQPKTEAALKREKVVQKKRIIPQKVNQNHYIPKFLLKKYWSHESFIYKNIKETNSIGIKHNIKIACGSWGYGLNLYSDYLEAYFGLLEGDASRPIEMLLNIEPLNGPQRDALIGFIVIQRIRNPHFINSISNAMMPLIIEEEGEEKAKNKEYMRRVYETLYSQNEFYAKLAQPIVFSRWVLVRSQSADFVLPDVCNIFGHYDDKQFVFMPLTPFICLVVLPVRVKRPRLVPHFISATSTIVRDISYILFSSARQEFISAKDKIIDFNGNEDVNDVVKRTILALTKITDNDMPDSFSFSEDKLQ